MDILHLVRALTISTQTTATVFIVMAPMATASIVTSTSSIRRRSQMLMNSTTMKPSNPTNASRMTIMTFMTNVPDMNSVCTIFMARGLKTLITISMTNVLHLHSNILILTIISRMTKVFLMQRVKNMMLMWLTMMDKTVTRTMKKTVTKTRISWISMATTTVTVLMLVLFVLLTC